MYLKGLTAIAVFSIVTGASFAQDAKAIDALVVKADAMEQQLGSDYDKVIEGLELIDLSSAEGQEIAEVFKALQERCE
jgi:hypothetical protein